MATLLQINVDANNGSNGSIVRDIGTMALERGWKSYIAYGRNYIPCDSELIRVGNDWDVRWHGLETRLLDNHGLSSRYVTSRFLKKLDDIHPDIIHLHNIHGYYINYKLLFEYIVKNDIPVVWTFHDCWPFTGHCGYFELHHCEKWKTKCEKCPAFHGYPSSWIFDRSKHNFEIKKRLFTSLNKLVITTVSKWLRELVKESFINKYPVELVYNGVDTDIFCPRESHLREKYNIEGKFVLLSAAANWSISKGWNDFIRLSSLLPDYCVIVLVGVSKTQMKKLPANIIGVPRQEGKKELAEYYSMADILLNLSYQETFGMTTAEAMACGTPGISYNKTACPELLSHETGIVVEAGNMEQILCAISEMKNKGKAYYSKACRQRVLNKFDFKKVNKAFFDIYDIILKNK